MAEDSVSRWRFEGFGFPVSLFWIALVCAALLLLPSLERYHGDERFYTDAALQMLRSGDWLTPRYEDGAPRFRKPVMAYWVVAAGFKAFGVGIVQSRVLFAMAGAAWLFLTARLACVCGCGTTGSVLAAAVLGSNIETLALATRATPDILANLFSLASLFAFARILFRHDRSWRAYALAWVGAGLCAATKGFIGILPVMFSLIFSAYLRFARHSERCPSIVSLPWATVGLLVGIAWHIAIASRYGPASLLHFASDQIVAKVQVWPLMVGSNAIRYAEALIRYNLIWLVLAAPILWKHRIKCVSVLRNGREEIVFLAGWVALHVVVFSFSSVFRARYVSSAFPTVAILMTQILLLRSSWDGWPGWISAVTGICGGCVVLAATLGTAAAMRLGSPGSMIGLAVGAAGIAILCSALGRRRDSCIAGAAFVAPAMMLIATLVVRPMFVSFPVAALSRYLVSNHPEIRRVLVSGMLPETMAQIRLFSGGRIDGRTLRSGDPLPPAEAEAPILIASANASEWEKSGYSLERTGIHWRKVKTHDILNALWNGEQPKGLAIEILIAHPRERDLTLRRYDAATISSTAATSR